MTTPLIICLIKYALYSLSKTYLLVHQPDYSLILFSSASTVKMKVYTELVVVPPAIKTAELKY